MVTNIVCKTICYNGYVLYTYLFLFYALHFTANIGSSLQETKRSSWPEYACFRYAIFLLFEKKKNGKDRHDGFGVTMQTSAAIGVG
jgi:hypothetical protein